MGSDESAADTLMEDLKSSSLGSVCVVEEGQILSCRCVLWLALLMSGSRNILLLFLVGVIAE